MIVVALFILGGLALGCSMVFFFTPQHINRRKVLNFNIGPKVKDKGTEGMLNRIISIDEKISAAGTAMGIFLLLLTAILFWLGLILLK